MFQGPKHHFQLVQRASASKGRWTSTCGIFSSQLNPVPHAELYFTWVQHYLVVALLNAMHILHRNGKVPADVEFAMSFSGHEHLPEARCLQRIARFAHRITQVPYHEHNLHRGRANPSVAIFRVKDFNISELELAARNVCHKGNVVEKDASPAMTFRSDFDSATKKGNQMSSHLSSR